ncbi:hypothetical protein LSTR_LSTR015801 [Laodelphax striatellus]|uniref:Uncharacterized protein n=1 Tax=Laodelphax striatellus TaxID=195883 RepID=A0A482X7R9_LAOST|nr:hypothetical protein LSTR_LSTR015801 [Laodelphax striatellus]
MEPTNNNTFPRRRSRRRGRNSRNSSRNSSLNRSQNWRKVNGNEDYSRKNSLPVTTTTTAADHNRNAVVDGNDLHSRLNGLSHESRQSSTDNVVDIGSVNNLLT